MLAQLPLVLVRVIMTSSACSAIAGAIGYILARKYLYPVEEQKAAQNIEWIKGAPFLKSAQHLKKELMNYTDNAKLVEDEVTKICRVYDPNIIGWGIMKKGVPSDVKLEFVGLIEVLVNGGERDGESKK